MKRLIVMLLLAVAGLGVTSCAIAYKNSRVRGDIETTEIGLVGMTDNNAIPGGMLPLWRHSRPLNPPPAQ